MKTLITLFVTLSLSLSAIAGDSVAIGTTPSVSPRIAVEGQTCTGVGTAAITSTGLPLSCQSGVWEKLTLPGPPRYQCPSAYTANGVGAGQWASYGCTGQISTSSTCLVVVYPYTQYYTCPPIL